MRTLLIPRTGWPRGLLLMLPMLALAWNVGAATAVVKEPIRLGMVNAQSGPAAALGQGMLAGARAVFDEINARGGVHGRKISLRVADDGYEPEQTVTETLKLVQDDDVLALFGYVGTPTTNAVLPLLGELGVPLVGVFSGAASLRVPVTPQLFNVRASYDDEAVALVAHLVAHGAKKVAVVYQNDGFGMAVLSAVDKALRRHGMQLHATASFQRNTVAIRMALATMLEQQPDTIVLAGPYVPVAAFAKQARALGMQARLATVSFVGTESLMARLDPAGPSVLVSQVVPFVRDSSHPITRDCGELLQRYAGEALSYVSFEGCISARTLVAALERAGPLPTRSKLMRSLEAIKDLDLGGFRVSFSAADHQGNDQVFLTQIVGGRILEVR